MMARLHRIHYGSQSFLARSGQLLLDAALIGGADIPHDCRAGRCGACLTRVRRGITLDGESHQPGFVHACRARVFSDLTIEIEDTPKISVVEGKVAAIANLTLDVVEVAIAPSQQLRMLPGQYCRFRFRGFSPRAYSPTAPLTRLHGDRLLRLNVKRVRGGAVSNAFGKRIRVGDAVSIEGPFGHAYHRPGKWGRLVLVGTGTGFAPIWAVASAALVENPQRRLYLVAGARDLKSLYMAPALVLASQFASATVVPCVEALTQPMNLIMPGPATAYLPPDLNPEDTVYAAGAPRLVAAVAETARNRGATIYCDPFEPQHSSTRWLEMARQWLR